MRAVAYIRVSDISQIDGHSLDAQERLFRELCLDRGWEPIGVYREEGKSAHVDSVKKRPTFRTLLEESEKGQFEVVVVHTLDRWSRNLRVMLESMNVLTRHGVGLVSITENIDYSTPAGKMAIQMLGSVAEFFSEALSNHVKKGISERIHKGRHLGAVPFGYVSCWRKSEGERKLTCKPEHHGGIHIHPEEGPTVKTLFARYTSGTITLATLASWLNDHGFRTRNKKNLPDGNGNFTAGPRLFTNASVRHILHNPLYAGKIRHRDRVLPGAHDALVSEQVFQTVQVVMKRNSGRSGTLRSQPKREYLLKGLIQCAHCRMPMWAQTFSNGNKYYREQRGSRGAGYCVGRSGSMPCDIPDEQVVDIISAVTLPEAWVDRVLTQANIADEVMEVEEERKKVQHRLRRLGTAYVDGLYDANDYCRQKKLLEEKLLSLVVSDRDVIVDAGKLLDHIPELWDKAKLPEKRKILSTMLDAVYVDTVEERRIVAIRPKSAFRPLFEIAIMRDDSGILLTQEEVDGDLCFWWRRGRVESYLNHKQLVMLAA